MTDNYDFPVSKNELKIKKKFGNQCSEWSEKSEVTKIKILQCSRRYERRTVKLNVTASKICREAVRVIVIVIFYRPFVRFLRETTADRPTESKHDRYATKSNEHSRRATSVASDRDRRQKHSCYSYINSRPSTTKQSCGRRAYVAHSFARNFWVGTARAHCHGTG